MAGNPLSPGSHHTSCFDVKDILFEHELKWVNFLYTGEKSNLKIWGKKDLLVDVDACCVVFSTEALMEKMASAVLTLYMEK